MGPPSSGGLLFALMFNMLEEEDLNKANAHDPNNILISHMAYFSNHSFALKIEQFIYIS